MQDQLSRKNGDLFRSVVTSTFRACAKCGEPAVGTLPAILRMHAQTAQDGSGSPDTGQTAEAREHSSRPSRILLWNGDAIDCTLCDRSSVGAAKVN